MDLLKIYAAGVITNMDKLLMIAIRKRQNVQVLRLLRKEDNQLCQQEWAEVVWCAASVRNKDSLLKLFSHLSKNSFLCGVMFCFEKTRSYQENGDRGEIFWIFNTLYKAGKIDIAMHVAVNYPEKILINRQIWAKVIPEFDKSPSKFCIYCVTRSHRNMEISRVFAPTGDGSLISLKHWCVENCYANMVLYLAVITKDWALMETIATTLSRRIYGGFLIEIIEILSHDSIRACYAAAAVLKSYSLFGIAHLFPRNSISERLTNVCEEQGLLDWALLFSSDFAFIKRHNKNCQDQDVLGCILKRAVHNKNWEFANELLPRISNVRILWSVLHITFEENRIAVAKTVINNMDPTTTMTDEDDLNKLLVKAVYCKGANRDYPCHLVRLCIASGLSTFVRPTVLDIIHCLDSFWLPVLRLMRLFIESGICTHETLHQLRTPASFTFQGRLVVRPRLSTRHGESYRYIQEAAATPCSLRHLARLTISHRIGCWPGRSQRIQALPLPNKLKQYVRFRDVLAADSQLKKKSVDGEK